MYPAWLSYSAPLEVTFRLNVWDVDEESGIRQIKGIKEQEVLLSDIFLMTKNGTFIINGVERVVVSQCIDLLVCFSIMMKENRMLQENIYILLE